MAMDYSTLGRYYTRLSEAYDSVEEVTSKGMVDQVEFGFGTLDEDGATQFELYIQVTWYGRNRPIPEAQLITDNLSSKTWGSLLLFAPLFADMARPEYASVQPAEFCVLLERHGFKNELAAV